MRPTSEMTVDEMRAESVEVYSKLSKLRFDDPMDEDDEYIGLDKRWRELDAEVHRRMMADQTLAGAIYRAQPGFQPTPKRVI